MDSPELSLDPIPPGRFVQRGLTESMDVLRMSADSLQNAITEAWQKIVKIGTIGPTRVGLIELPRWGARDPQMQRLVTFED